MNPNSKTITVRCLVGKKAEPTFEARQLPSPGTDRTINLNKAGNLFFYACRRLWQRSPKRGMRGVMFNESNTESGESAGTSNTIPAFLFKQLIENN
jgi:hypothetical protein